MEVHHIQLLVISVYYRNVWRLDTDSQNLRDYLKKCKRSSLNCIGGILIIKEDPVFVKYCSLTMYTEIELCIASKHQCPVHQ